VFVIYITITVLPTAIVAIHNPNPFYVIGIFTISLYIAYGLILYLTKKTLKIVIENRNDIHNI
jgi:hypothetical protein